MLFWGFTVARIYIYKTVVSACLSVRILSVARVSWRRTPSPWVFIFRVTNGRSDETAYAVSTTKMPLAVALKLQKVVEIFFFFWRTWSWMFTIRVTNGSTFRWRATPTCKANRSVTDRRWERGTGSMEAQTSTSCNGKERIYGRYGCLQREKRPGVYGRSPLPLDWCTGEHQ